ncbi:hypothetical protein [Pengzhenrongella frigida]|uniref:Uncharacterized protein n=1 Tax=Pengzhenrongella frigida TaxID=1259133 RepID=A0A4Q5MVH3_9MICO|nr:hypothetical protein [Cellulomonas sp. HLT2-17]RYV49469.1 hypothetical protein EUA98_18635 [Cellulomonas sp. HLT2-17]
MTTMTISPSTTPGRTPLQAVSDARRWVRETPAPRWEGDAGAKAVFAAYVGGSVVVWTVLGMSMAGLLGQLLTAVSQA